MGEEFLSCDGPCDQDYMVSTNPSSNVAPIIGPHACGFRTDPPLAQGAVRMKVSEDVRLWRGSVEVPFATPGVSMDG